MRQVFLSLLSSFLPWVMGDLSSMGFETSIKIHFDEGDPAGVAFSGHLFGKMHRCYETFVEEALGHNPQSFFLKSQVIYPLRHFEGEYFKPLLPLSTYGVRMGVLKISQTGFRLEYEVHGDSPQVMACFRSTHVAVDGKTWKKKPLPQEFKESLEKFVIS